MISLKYARSKYCSSLSVSETWFGQAQAHGAWSSQVFGPATTLAHKDQFFLAQISSIALVSNTVQVSILAYVCFVLDFRNELEILLVCCSVTTGSQAILRLKLETPQYFNMCVEYSFYCCACSVGHPCSGEASYILNENYPLWIFFLHTVFTSWRFSEWQF